MTKVIHIKDAPKNWQQNPDYVYIGRGGKGLSGYWGNPFPLVNEDQRAEILAKYIKWFLFQWEVNATYMDRIRELKDKTLICFCVPKLCHGNILALIADIMEASI